MSIWYAMCIQMHSDEVHIVFNQTHVHHTFARQTQVFGESSDIMWSTYHPYTSCLKTSPLITVHIRQLLYMFQQHSHFMTNLGFLTLFLNTFCRGVLLHCSMRCHLQNHWILHHSLLHCPQMLQQDWPHSPVLVLHGTAQEMLHRPMQSHP